MKLAVCYLCVTHGTKTLDYAARFAGTYHSFAPGAEHELFVICNGGPLSTETALVFQGLRAKCFPRKNDPGWDISACLEIARTICASYEAIVWFGESSYFHREGWLKRFVNVWDKWGPGLYGSLSSNALRPHLQTNSFCCAPFLLEKWSFPVRNKTDRYNFEHGPTPFWRQVVVKGFPVRLVTWDGDWGPREWRKPPNIFWRGDQSNCLMWNNHTDRWASADPTRKQRWSKNADSPFR